MANWNPEQIRFGNKVKDKLAEKPDAGSFENGVSHLMNTGDNLDRTSRKAGQAVGIRKELMSTDPEVQENTTAWWEAFKMSPNAQPWSQARMQNEASKLGMV